MSELTNCCSPQSKKIISALFGVLVAFSAIYLIVLIRNQLRAYNYIGRVEGATRAVSISGEGKITALPDIAAFNIGVLTEKKTVVDAQKENTDKMNKITAGLKKIGVDEKDIKTTNYNIYPQYDWIDGRQILRGYQLDQSIQVKVRKLDKLGEIMTQAGELGANNVSGLNFTIDDPEVLRQQAREQAILQAKAKADTLAKMADIKLGKLISFTEFSPESPIYYDYAKSAAGGIGGGGPAPSIQSGSLEVIITVNISYEVL